MRNDPADAKQRLADHAALAKQSYQKQYVPLQERRRVQIIFPYLQGP